MQRAATLLILLLAAGAAAEGEGACSLLKGSLFPTGVDDQGAKLGQGAADAHWVAYKPGKPQPQALAAAPIVLTNDETFGWAHDDDAGRVGTSQWIGAYDEASALYRFDHAFTVPAHADLASVAIEAQLAASYSVLSVELNGESVYTPTDPILSATPGRALRQSIRLPALTQRKNTLSVVVLPGGTKKRGFLSLWFPQASYRPVEGVNCSGDSDSEEEQQPDEPQPVPLPPISISEGVEEPSEEAAVPVLIEEDDLEEEEEGESTEPPAEETETEAAPTAPDAGATGGLDGGRRRRRAAASVVGADGHVTGLEDRLARGLFTPKERLRGLQGDDAAAATLSAPVADEDDSSSSSSSSPPSSCQILDLRPTVDPTTKTTTWKGVFRFHDAANVQGPWAPAVRTLQEEDWVALGRPAFANWLFYETNFSLPSDVDAAGVTIAGHLGADLLALGVWVNGQPAWLNPAPFALPARASDPVPFALKGARYAPGINTLGVAVLADPGQNYRTMARVNFETAAYAGCNGECGRSVGWLVGWGGPMGKMSVHGWGGEGGGMCVHGPLLG
jgi:hypothetical protein